MNIYELPERYKKYTLTLSDKTEYTISGEEKLGIMRSRSQLIELRSGEVINKAFMSSISLDRDETKSVVNKLPASEIKLIEEEIANKHQIVKT